MRAVDIIEDKKCGRKLTREQIEFMVKGFTDGDIPDYQMSALLMAVYFSQMDEDETSWLTQAMADSGDKIDLSPIKGIKVDKHSTGGVGDKTSLVLAPMVAALNVPVAKMSGRGLGHTGGTIDKLESIPGFNTALSEEAFFENVNRIGIALTGQTGNLAPADKKIYALRDVTATVNNISLIASSIMSKKLASGADAIVLDVKCGSGAFMKNEYDACKLAEIMVDIGKKAGRRMCAVISDMNQPLGNAVGNSIEVIEAIDTLKGNGPEDLTELCLVLGSYMVMFGGRAQSYDEAYAALKDTITSGAALEKFKEFVAAQGGNTAVVDDYGLFPKAAIEEPVRLADWKLDRAGIRSIDCGKVGTAAMVLGGGRVRKGEAIDLSVGIYFYKKVGSIVDKEDVVAVIYGNDVQKVAEARKLLMESIEFTDEAVEAPKLIHQVKL